MIDKGPFKEKSREVKYQNKWLKVEEAQVTRPDGSDGIFGLVYALPGVVVVALDAEQNVMLVKEYKYAMERETIELISGGLDANEGPEKAAIRELREETGYVAETTENLGTIEPLTTVVSCTNTIILATDLEYKPLEIPDADIVEPLKIPFKETLAMIDRGEINDGMSVAALLRVARKLNIH